MGRKLILIAGIPGVGKTAMGDFLESRHYLHIDMEKYHRTRRVLDDTEAFILRYFPKDRNIVLTWGFSPDEKTIKVINRLHDYGFRIYWFEGNSRSARKAAMKRKGFDEAVLKKQMDSLSVWNVPRNIHAKRIGVFDKKGEFRKLSDIARRIRAIR